MYELDTRSSDSMAVSLIFAVVFGGIAVGLVVGATQGEIGLLIPAAILGVIGFFALANVLHQVRKRMIIAVPKIAVSTQSVKGGDSFDLVYEQKFKARTHVKNLQVQFILRESATYTQGTDTYTVHHDNLIQEIALQPETYRAGHLLQRNWKFNVPPNAMHTFKGNNNKLLWLILVKLEYNRNMKSNYQSEMIVLPATPLNI